MLAVALLVAGCDEAPSAPPRLLLGTGEGELVALDDGDPLRVVSGCQGGRHVLVSLRAERVEATRARITIALTADDGAALALPFDVSLTLAQVGGASELTGVLVLLDLVELIGRLGTEVTLSATLTIDGATLTASTRVRLVEGAACTRDDAGMLDAGWPVDEDAGSPIDEDAALELDAGVAPDAGPPIDAGPPLLFTDATRAVRLFALADPPASAPTCLYDDLISTPPNDYCIPQFFNAGVAVADYDGDGDPDVLLPRQSRDAVLLRNEGGTFIDVTARAGLTGTSRTVGAGFADLDGDRDLDLYLTRIAARSHLLFINQGDGTFVEEGVARGAAIVTPELVYGTTPALGDYDRDGDVDLFVGEWRLLGPMAIAPSRARLLRNRGDGSFEDATDAAGIVVGDTSPMAGGYRGTFAFTPAFVDLDGDGWLDLPLTSDFGTARMYWNRGDGTFERGVFEPNGDGRFDGMGATFADLDADGDLDWAGSGIHTSIEVGNRLFLNQGSRMFSDVAARAGVADGGWAWGLVALDADLDGDIDLAQVNGYPASMFSDDRMRLFSNEGALAFVDRAAEWGTREIVRGRGIASLDVEGDGDLDLVISRSEAMPVLLRSDASARAHWLRVHAIGTVSGVDALGARVEIVPAVGLRPRVAVVGAQAGYLGHGERAVVFGLGDHASPVRELRVTWPRTGRTTSLLDVAVDREIVIVEP